MIPTIEEIHEVYILERDRPVPDICRQFGRSVDWMYKAFRSRGLPLRRDLPDEFTPDRIRMMHRAYMTSRELPWMVASKFGIGVNRMYGLFDQEGIIERRGHGPKPRIQRDPNICPEQGAYEFCAECPCPPPASCEDWHCETCMIGADGLCACRSQTLRARANWEEARATWERRRQTKNKQLARMRARADDDHSLVHVAQGKLRAHSRLGGA